MIIMEIIKVIIFSHLRKKLSSISFKVSLLNLKNKDLINHQLINMEWEMMMMS